MAHTREELRAYLRARGEAWREDPTNQDPALDRNFLRLFVFPLLEERFPAAKRALARFAEARAEEEGVLERQAEARLLPDPRFFVPAFRAAPLLEAPLAVRRRALRRLLEKLGLRPEARLVLLLEEALRGRPQTLPGASWPGARGHPLPPPPKAPPAPAPGVPPPRARGLPGAAFREEAPRGLPGGKGVPRELKPLWPVRAEGNRVVEVLGLYPPPPEEAHMAEALAEAASAFREGEVPVGAVLVLPGRVLRAHNRVEGLRDPTAHAEMLLLREAGPEARGGRLYVTLEPCLMCHHALAQAGVEVVYGAENLKEGALTRFGLPTRARGGVRERECAKLLRDFFARLREGCRSG